MANVLTALAADIYKAADMVAREAVGFIPSVTINAGSEAAAQGDIVRSFFTRQPTINTTATPSMTIPEGDDQTIDNKTMTVGQIASARIPWTGEDIAHVNNGSGFTTIYGDQVAQAMRGIVNTIEAYTAVKLAQGASRAFGTAGTTPFGSNFNEVANVRQILVDNGAPLMMGGLSLVMNTAAGTNMRNISTLYKANEAGTDQMLRQGTLLDLHGFMMRESGQILPTTKGTGTAYTTSAAGFAIGATSIPIITGSGTVLAGDIVTFAGDTNKYVVATGVAAPGTIVLQAPGLRVAIAASATAMTIGNSYTGNIGLWRGAAELVVRPLKKPMGGDAAVDTMTVQDDRSMLAFQVSVYKGYNKAMIDITTLYDFKVWKPEYVVALLG